MKPKRARLGFLLFAALTVLLLAPGAHARAPVVDILSPLQYAPPVPCMHVRFTFSENQLVYETVLVTVDGVDVRLDPANDGQDNDGDALVDEPGESVWSELSDTCATMVSWLPYRLRADDPVTPENEGMHTIRVGAYNTLREWGESVSRFEVTTELSSLDAYCYPNPFRPEEGSTQIAFTLTSSAEVTIEVYDFPGNKLATLCKDEWRDAGIQQEPCDRWWGRDSRTDRRVPAGAYFVKVAADRDGQTESAVAVVGVLPK